jgi:hypothetical protein
LAIFCFCFLYPSFFNLEEGDFFALLNPSLNASAETSIRLIFTKKPVHPEEQARPASRRARKKFIVPHKNKKMNPSRWDFNQIDFHKKNRSP